MLIGETWLNRNKIFKIPNYEVHPNDRTEQPRGGAAILVKKSIPHTALPKRGGQFENTVVDILLNQKRLTVLTTNDLHQLFPPVEKTASW